MEVKRKEIIFYITHNGKQPFLEWFNSVKDLKTQAKINKRLVSVSLGNLGDYKSIGGGIFELRINYGSGYRIYFGQDGETLIILLCGGDKSSQKKDIETAKIYWSNYKS
jgi:putative addiction module killer protein